jgi:ubiquitin-conjugating enzyme E2 O
MIVHGRSEQEMRVGDRVRLKDTTGIPTTRHSQEGDGSDVISVETLLVTETETTLDILWQDGLHETLKSTEVIPYLNPDEYDCW